MAKITETLELAGLLPESDLRALAAMGRSQFKKYEYPPISCSSCGKIIDPGAGGKVGCNRWCKRKRKRAISSVHSQTKAYKTKMAQFEERKRQEPIERAAAARGERGPIRKLQTNPF